MIIRALDGDHDWLFGKGKQSYLYQNNAIAENIQTRLLEFLNDCFFNLQAGIDWIRLLSQKNTRNEIVLSVRSVILKSEGVVQVVSLDANVLTNRELTLSFTIDTIYTRQFSQTVQIVV